MYMMNLSERSLCLIQVYAQIFSALHREFVEETCYSLRRSKAN